MNVLEEKTKASERESHQKIAEKVSHQKVREKESHQKIPEKSLIKRYEKKFHHKAAIKSVSPADSSAAVHQDRGVPILPSSNLAFSVLQTFLLNTM